MVADSAAWAQAFGRAQRDWPQEGAGDPAEASEDSPQRELAMRIADPAVMRYFASPSSQGARLRATRGRSQKWSRARRWSEFPEVAGVKDPYFDPNAKRPHGSPPPRGGTQKDTPCGVLPEQENNIVRFTERDQRTGKKQTDFHQMKALTFWRH